MAKHRLVPQPRQHPRVWLRVAGAVALVALVVLAAYGLAGDLGRAQDAAVVTQVDPMPHTVDVASTPVVRLVVPHGA